MTQFCLSSLFSLWSWRAHCKYNSRKAQYRGNGLKWCYMYKGAIIEHKSKYCGGISYVICAYLPPPRRLSFLGLLICWLVCLLAGLRKNEWPDFHETWWTGVAWTKEEHIKFWSRFESVGWIHQLFFSFLTLQDRWIVTPASIGKWTESIKLKGVQLNIQQSKTATSNITVKTNSKSVISLLFSPSQYNQKMPIVGYNNSCIITNYFL